MALPKFKRGATFRAPCQLVDDDGVGVDITNVTITCHVRKNLSGSETNDRCDNSVAECVVEKTNALNGDFEVVSALTSGWPLGELYMDVRYIGVTHADEIDISETISFECVIEATRS